MHLTDEEIAELEAKATAIRGTIIDMLVAAGSGHTAGPLGMADIFSALYFHILKHDPQDPDWEGRDRLILSYFQTATRSRSATLPWRMPGISRWRSA
jgi:transketolase